jgi:hypothetical protein
MKILTILIGTLVLNMFDASNCRADETAAEAMLRAESLGRLRLGLPEKDVIKLLGSPATRVNWCSRKRTETTCRIGITQTRASNF